MANPTNPDDFRVSVDSRGRFDVIAPDGAIVGTHDTPQAAHRQADALNQKLAHDQPSPAPPSPAPASPAPPADDPPEPFSVFSFGDGGGFGFFDQKGTPGPKFFKTRPEAERHAADARAAFDRTVADLQAIAARAPVPPGPRTRDARGRFVPSSGASPLPSPSGAPTPGPTGLGGAVPQIGGLADALAKAAEALTGIANASQGIDLADVPSRGKTPTSPAATASFARKAIDGLMSSIFPGVGPSGLAGIAEALKNFKQSFAPGSRQPHPIQAPSPLGPMPGGYPARRPQPGWHWQRGKADDDTCEVLDVTTRMTPGIAKSVGQAIASHFQGLKRAVVGAYASTGAPQGWAGVAAAMKGFASNFAHAAGNPAGGIPFGAGGWAGNVANQFAGQGAAFANVVGTVASRVGAGITAAIQARQAGATGFQVARAFAGGVGGATGAALGAFVGMTASVAGAGVAFAALVQQMRSFSEEVVAGNRHLMRWNGGLSAAYMGLSIGDYRRNVQLGHATQGSAITAVRAVDAMRDSWLGVDILNAEVRNRGAGFAASFAGSVGADLSALARPIARSLQNADPNGLILSGVGAGLGATPGGFVRGLYNEFLNNPLGSVLSLGISPLIGGLKGAMNASANAAAAKVTQLGAGVLDNNPWGTELHRRGRGGPILRRPTPKP